MCDLKLILSPPHGKRRFLRTINKKGKLVDVGCGNNSPYYIKSRFPEVYYIGIDIGDYNQTKPNLANEYILTTPDDFADAIAKIVMKEEWIRGGGIDTVISSHNLEHCNNREKTLDAMMSIIKSGGKMFLSFPSQRSINFPYRSKGILNYYQDPTHKYSPPDFDEIIKKMKENNFNILFSSASYKPVMHFLVGLFLEPLSRLTGRVFFNSYATWSYWGFEAVIWAEKK